jgi:hypothetical protein
VRVTLGDLRQGGGFVRRLPALLRAPISAAAARVVLRHRLESREAAFLAMARQSVYARPSSPYHPLLRQAGCDYGDLERLVQQEGVEGALRTLLRHGVYLRASELKGLQEILRGTVAVPPEAGGFRNPAAAAHIPGQSSGSRGARFGVPLDLGFVQARAVDYALLAAELFPERVAHAVWKTPGGDVLDNLLCFAATGAVAERWFLQVDPAAPGLHPAYRWSARALRAGAWLAGVRFPPPQVVPFDDPLPIVRWLAASSRAGASPLLQVFTSPALRLLEAAAAAGLRLDGVRFMIGGEPLTPARVAAFRAARVTLVPRYGTAEAPSIAIGCSAGPAPDAVHLLSDLYAVIQADGVPAWPGLSPRALFITSLCPTAPLILLNASLGDSAALGRATCGCPLSTLGWATQLHTIRSFEKLTAGGMMVLDEDVIRILEEVLPVRFGGGPTDYQLVEGEAGDGRPLLRLLVHPRVPLVNPDVAREAFLAAVDQGSETARVMGLAWRDAGLLTVERSAPIATASGKILHLCGAPAARAGSRPADG